MSVVASKRKLYDFMEVYEENYARLVCLAPLLACGQEFVSQVFEGVPGLCMTMLEHSRYTTTLAFTHRLGLAGLVPDPVMKVRIYHDAQVVEVLSFQGHQRFRPFYPYPNSNMYHHHEKDDVNRFFGEWLAYCLARGYKFRPNGITS